MNNEININELAIQLNHITEETGLTDSFEKRWFCVAICNDSTIFMDDADSPKSFMPVLDKAIIAWVDFRTRDFEKDVYFATELGFSKLLVSSLLDDQRLLYNDLDTELGVKLQSVQIRMREGQPVVQPHEIFLLMGRNFVFTVHPLDVDRRFSLLRRYSDKILKKVPIEISQEDKLTMLLIRIIDQNNDRNFEHLRQIEEHGDELNKVLMDPKTPREMLGPQIYGMKHALITYLNALWQTVDVLHDLRYGDAELISDKEELLKRISLLTDDVNNQIGLAEHMSEVLASGLEVLQSIYNNQLQVVNNKLSMVITYLTVLGTAVLVPNTLATIMSSSAFDLQPSDIWWYITLLVVATTAATWASFWWVRKVKMPRKAD
jgi:magnesium transporter